MEDVADKFFGDMLQRGVSVVPAVTIWWLLMTLDLITGWIKGRVTNTLSSKVSFNGMLKKCSMMAMIAAAVLLELLLSYTGTTLPAGKLFALYLCSTEIFSITENAKAAGLPMPKWWADALGGLNKEPTTTKPLASIAITFPESSEAAKDRINEAAAESGILKSKNNP